MCQNEGVDGIEERRKGIEDTRLGRGNQMLLLWNQGVCENQRLDQEDWMPGEED